MKSETVIKIVLLTMIALQTNIAWGQIGIDIEVTNPDQYVAIKTGAEKEGNVINSQTKKIGEITALQTGINAAMMQIKKWQADYNSYLQTVGGYAEGIKAASTLYIEGGRLIHNLLVLVRVGAKHPEGIFSTVPMNNLYIETFAQFLKTYQMLKNSLARGGITDMQNGAERTQMLWMLDDEMRELNEKIRALTRSVAYYELIDVWNMATGGLYDRGISRIARQSLSDWRRVAKAYKTLADAGY